MAVVIDSALVFKRVIQRANENGWTDNLGNKSLTLAFTYPKLGKVVLMISDLKYKQP